MPTLLFADRTLSENELETRRLEARRQTQLLHKYKVRNTDTRTLVVVDGSRAVTWERFRDILLASGLHNIVLLKINRLEPGNGQFRNSLCTCGFPQSCQPIMLVLLFCCKQATCSFQLADSFQPVVKPQHKIRNRKC